MKRLLRSKSDYQKTLLRNQLTSLILYESIKTTTARAKKLVSFANHFFSKVRKVNLSSRKLAYQILLDKNAVRKIFEEILPRYKKENVSFVKILSLVPRVGDRSDMSLVSLTEKIKIDEKVAEKTQSETEKNEKTK